MLLEGSDSGRKQGDFRLPLQSGRLSLLGGGNGAGKGAFGFGQALGLVLLTVALRGNLGLNLLQQR